jgi:hypothetical protein
MISFNKVRFWKEVVICKLFRFPQRAFFSIVFLFFILQTVASRNIVYIVFLFSQTQYFFLGVYIRVLYRNIVLINIKFVLLILLISSMLFLLYHQFSQFLFLFICAIHLFVGSVFFGCNSTVIT